MSFNIVLKRYTNEATSFTKTFDEQTETLTGELKTGTDLVNPVVLVSSPSIAVYNYAEINAFSRKYFITSIKSYRTGLWEIHLHCDVLSTYASQIKSCTATIARTVSDGFFNRKLNDNRLIISNDVTQKITELAVPFNNHIGYNITSAVLTVGGGS